MVFVFIKKKKSALTEMFWYLLNDNYTDMLPKNHTKEEKKLHPNNIKQKSPCCLSSFQKTIHSPQSPFR